MGAWAGVDRTKNHHDSAWQARRLGTGIIPGGTPALAWAAQGSNISDGRVTCFIPPGVGRSAVAWRFLRAQGGAAIGMRAKIPPGYGHSNWRGRGVSGFFTLGR